MNKTFSTFDLALATAISLYFPVDSLDRSKDQNKVLFVFSSNKELEDIADKYWKGELLVEPGRYFQNLKSLKSRLYSEK